MNVAIIISGGMRTFDRCLPNHHWFLYQHLPKADFFVSTYRDGTEDQAELLRARYPDNRVEISIDDAQPDCVAEIRGSGVALPEEWVKGQPYTHEPYPITVHPQAVLRQLWQLQQGWTFANQFFGHVAHYDLIIRVRPDIWFHSCELAPWIASRMAREETAITPWWGRFGGINDRFALLGPKAALPYFTTYARIPALMTAGAPLHPETLVMKSLLSADCKIRYDLDAEFSTRRTNGEFRVPEIWHTDIAHFRGR